MTFESITRAQHRKLRRKVTCAPPGKVEPKSCTAKSCAASSRYVNLILFAAPLRRTRRQSLLPRGEQSNCWSVTPSPKFQGCRTRAEREGAPSTLNPTLRAKNLTLLVVPKAAQSRKQRFNIWYSVSIAF